ncbi:AsmA family protein [Shigella sonnei]
MDADVRFKGRRIQHGSSLPISDLSTHIILKSADLRLQPLKFGMAGGSIAAIFIWKAIKSRCKGGIYSGPSAETERTDAGCGMMKKTLGEMNGDAELRGSGNSVAAFLGKRNGNLKLLMNDGLVSRNLMEMLAECRQLHCRCYIW